MKKISLCDYVANKIQREKNVIISLDKKMIDKIYSLSSSELLKQINAIDSNIKSAPILKDRHFKRYIESLKSNKNKTVIYINKLFKKFLSNKSYMELYSCTHNYTQILHYDNYYFTLSSNKLYKNISSLKKQL